MNVQCLGYAGSCKMLGFVYRIRSRVSSRLLKVLRVCVLGLSPVLSPGHAPTSIAKLIVSCKLCPPISYQIAKLPLYLSSLHVNMVKIHSDTCTGTAQD